MRPFFTFTIAALILTACATSPTPPPTVDIITSATATIIPPTETPTPTAIVSVIAKGEPSSLLVLMTVPETYPLLLDNIHVYLPEAEAVKQQDMTLFNFAYEMANENGEKSIESAYEMAKIKIGANEQLAFLTAIDGEAINKVYSWAFSRMTEEGVQEVFYVDNQTGELVVVMRSIKSKPGFMEFYLADSDDLTQRTMLTIQMTLDVGTSSSNKMATFINKSFLPESAMSEKGLEMTVNGQKYLLDTVKGKWVETDKATAIALFDMLGVSEESYELKRVDGSLVGVDRASGEEVFRDGNFDLRYAVEAAAASGKLEPTPYTPRSEGEVGVPNRPPANLYDEYLRPVWVEFKTEYNATSAGLERPLGPGTTSGIDLLIDPSTLSWGTVIRLYRDDVDTPNFLLYRQSDGKIIVVPLEQGSFDQVLDFWR